MINRRRFLEITTMAAAGAILSPKMGNAEHKRKIQRVGLQLYTLRDQLKLDFDATLSKVAKIGYSEVEFAGYYGRTGKQITEALKKNGLTSPAAHVQYDVLAKEKWPAQLEAAHAVGHKYLVQPWVPEELRKTLDDWKRVAETLNQAGESSKKAGIQLCYHNHWFEFSPVDGKLPYDLLLELCDAGLVKMEMDLCWIAAAGADPVKYFKKFPGRFPLVHVKDLKIIPKPTDKDPSKFLADVGSGIIDWKRILAKSETAGTKHYFVEHDAPGERPFEGISKSFKYLQKLRYCESSASSRCERGTLETIKKPLFSA